MELWGEAITVRAMAPSEAHVAVYLATLHLNPSKGDQEPHIPSHQTPPSGGKLHCLQAELGDLSDHELCQFMEDLTHKIVQCGIHVPSSSPPPNKWVCPLGGREVKEDDQEVTFPEGGRQVPLRQPTPSAEPEQSAGGRVPSGPPLQAPCPAPSGSDREQLITTLTSGLHLGTQKINTFSGDITPGETEISFEQWNHGVQCIKDHYPESVV